MPMFLSQILSSKLSVGSEEAKSMPRNGGTEERGNGIKDENEKILLGNLCFVFNRPIPNFLPTQFASPQIAYVPFALFS
jgi:hypothetical protein